jgi:hypothetical protein
MRRCCSCGGRAPGVTRLRCARGRTPRTCGGSIVRARFRGIYTAAAAARVASGARVKPEKVGGMELAGMWGSGEAPAPGRAVLVDPIKPTLKAPESERLKL